MIGLLRTYLRPYGPQVVVVMALLLVQAIGNLYLPDLNADIINNGVARGDNDYILRTGGLMLVVAGLLGVAAIAAVYGGARIAMGFGRDLRSAIFAKVETFSQVEVNHFGPASLITRNTNDVQQVQTLVFLALTVIISAPILIVGGVIMALRTDVPLSGMLVVVVPLMGLVIALVMSRAIPLFQAMQAKIDRINRVMRETLAGDALPAGAQSLGDATRMILNDRIDAAVAAFFLISVLVILVASAHEWFSVLSGRKAAKSSEIPFESATRAA